MKPVQAFIFDFGGVMVKMARIAPRIALAERLGVPLEHIDNAIFFSESARRASLGELTVTQHYELVRQSLGIPVEEMPAFLQQYWSADELNDELVGLIMSLRKRYKIGLLSNAWSDLRQTLDERFHIAEFFHAMVISAEEGIAKPDPRIYHMAVQRLGVPLDQAVFVDDMEGNIQAARQLGMQGILYRNNPQLLSDISVYNIGSHFY